MALRTIRIQGDPVLTKVCRPIPEDGSHPYSGGRYAGDHV